MSTGGCDLYLLEAEYHVIEGTQLVMEDAQMIRRKKTNGTRLENGSALTLFKVKEKKKYSHLIISVLKLSDLYILEKNNRASSWD